MLGISARTKRSAVCMGGVKKQIVGHCKQAVKYTQGMVLMPLLFCADSRQTGLSKEKGGGSGNRVIFSETATITGTKLYTNRNRFFCCYAYFASSSWRRVWPRRAAILAGVWPSLLARRSASLAPDCCRRKCMTRKRPRRAAKCSKVSCGLTSAGRGGRKMSKKMAFPLVSRRKGRTKFTKWNLAKPSLKDSSLANCRNTSETSRAIFF